MIDHMGAHLIRHFPLTQSSTATCRPHKNYVSSYQSLIMHSKQGHAACTTIVRCIHVRPLQHSSMISNVAPCMHLPQPGMQTEYRKPPHAAFLPPPKFGNAAVVISMRLQKIHCMLKRYFCHFVADDAVQISAYTYSTTWCCVYSSSAILALAYSATADPIKSISTMLF